MGAAEARSVIRAVGLLNDLQQFRLPPQPSDPPFSMSTRSPFPWKKYVGVALGLAALLGVTLSFIIPHVSRTVKAIALYDDANQLIDRGQYQRAIAAFDAALEIQSNFAEAWADRGYALGKLGQNEEKLRSCDRAIFLDPQLTEAWNCRGLAQHSLQKYEEAIKDYKKALQIDPNFYPAWYNEGESLFQLKQYRAVLIALTEAIKIKPDYLFAWTLKCKAHYQLQEYPEAQIACEEALQIDRDHELAKQWLNLVRQKLGR